MSDYFNILKQADIFDQGISPNRVPPWARGNLLGRFPWWTLACVPPPPAPCRIEPAGSSSPEISLFAACENDPQFGFRLMDNLAAEVALKIRGADLLIRQKILYYESKKDIPKNLLNFLDLTRAYRYNQKIKRAAIAGYLRG